MDLPATACPNCKTPVSRGATTCQDCGEDLAPLMRLQLAPYLSYNEGLRLAQAGDLDGSILKMRQVVAALPNEPSACVVLGKLYAQKGDRVNARQWWEMTLSRWPQENTARQGLAVLEAQEAANQALASQAQIRQRRRRRLQTFLIGLGSWLIGMLVFWVGSILIAQPTSVVVAVATPSVSPSPEPASPSPSPTRPVPTSSLAPSPTAGPTLTPPPALTKLVRGAIQSDLNLSGLNVTIRQEGNSIWLEGIVPTVGDKYKLEAIVKNVPGIKLVDVSGLEVIYPVKPGDTLSQISKDMYGQAALYGFIAQKNKLPNPNLIRAGITLKILPPP